MSTEESRTQRVLTDAAAMGSAAANAAARRLTIALGGGDVAELPGWTGFAEGVVVPAVPRSFAMGPRGQSRNASFKRGTTKTQRTSSTKNTIAAAGGLTRAAGPLANLAGVSGDTQLAGQGTTSRSTTLSTTLTARVAHVLPNGALVVEATKDIQINSERQTITVRGVVRPADIDATNSVRSDRLGQLEVRVNGKGVVGDAVRRPFILYRLLLGLLPF